MLLAVCSGLLFSGLVPAVSYFGNALTTTAFAKTKHEKTSNDKTKKTSTKKDDKKKENNKKKDSKNKKSASSASNKKSASSADSQATDIFIKALSNLSSSANTDVSKKQDSLNSSMKSANKSDEKGDDPVRMQKAHVWDDNLKAADIWAFMGPTNSSIWHNNSHSSFTVPYSAFSQANAEAQGAASDNYNSARQKQSRLAYKAANFGYAMYASGLDRSDNVGNNSKAKVSNIQSTSATIMQLAYKAANMVQSLFHLAVRILSAANVADWAKNGRASSPLFAPLADMMNKLYNVTSSLGLVIMLIIFATTLGLSVMGWQVTTNGASPTGVHGIINSFWTLLKRAFAVLVMPILCATMWFMMMANMNNAFDQKSNSVPSYAVYSNFFDYHDAVMHSRLAIPKDVDIPATADKGNLPFLSAQDVLTLNYRTAGLQAAGKFRGDSWYSAFSSAVPSANGGTGSNSQSNTTSDNDQAISLLNQWGRGDATNASDYASWVASYMSLNKDASKDEKKNNPKLNNDLTTKQFVENGDLGVNQDGNYQADGPDIYSGNLNPLEGGPGNRKGGLSTMAMYAYLLSTFDDKHVTMTSTNDVGTIASIPEHYNVTLVGNGGNAFGNWSMAIGLMLSMSILACGYMYLTFEAVLNAVPGMAAAILQSSVASLKGATRAALLVIGSAVGVVVASAMYTFTQMLLIAISGLSDSFLGLTSSGGGVAMLFSKLNLAPTNDAVGALSAINVHASSVAFLRTLIGWGLIYMAIRFVQALKPVRDTINQALDEAITKIMMVGGSMSGAGSAGTQNLLTNEMGGDSNSSNHSFASNLINGFGGMQNSRNAMDNKARTGIFSPTNLAKTAGGLIAGGATLKAGEKALQSMNGKNGKGSGKNGQHGKGQNGKDGKATHGNSQFDKAMQNLKDNAGNFGGLAKMAPLAATAANAASRGKLGNAAKDISTLAKGAKSPAEMSRAAREARSGENAVNQANKTRMTDPEGNALRNLVNEANDTAQGVTGQKAVSKDGLQNMAKDLSNATGDKNFEKLANSKKTEKGMQNLFGDDKANDDAKVSDSATDAANSDAMQEAQNTDQLGNANDVQNASGMIGQRGVDPNVAPQSSSTSNNQSRRNLQNGQSPTRQHQRQAVGVQKAKSNVAKGLAALGTAGAVSAMTGNSANASALSNMQQAVGANNATAANHKNASAPQVQQQGNKHHTMLDLVTDNSPEQAALNSVIGATEAISNPGAALANDAQNLAGSLVPGAENLSADQANQALQAGGIDTNDVSVNSVNGATEVGTQGSADVATQPGQITTDHQTARVAAQQQVQQGKQQMIRTLAQGVGASPTVANTIAADAAPTTAGVSGVSGVAPVSTTDGQTVVTTTTSSPTGGTTTTVTTPSGVSGVTGNMTTVSVPSGTTGVSGGTTTVTMPTGTTGVSGGTTTVSVNNGSGSIGATPSAINPTMPLGDTLSAVQTATTSLNQAQTASELAPNSPVLQQGVTQAQVTQRASQVQAMQAYNSQPATKYMPQYLNEGSTANVGAVNQAITNTYLSREALQQAIKAHGPNSAEARSLAQKYQGAMNYAQSIGLKSGIISPGNAGQLKSAYASIRSGQLNVLKGVDPIQS